MEEDDDEITNQTH